MARGRCRMRDVIGAGSVRGVGQCGNRHRPGRAGIAGTGHIDRSGQALDVAILDVVVVGRLCCTRLADDLRRRLRQLLVDGEGPFGEGQVGHHALEIRAGSQRVEVGLCLDPPGVLKGRVEGAVELVDSPIGQ